ncbi:carph-isopro domain-containing protein [Burkholderia sp. PU8-34]
MFMRGIVAASFSCVIAGFSCVTGFSSIESVLMNISKHTPRNEALERAIAHFGSLSAMARALGLSGYQVIQQWRTAGRVPAPHVPRLAELTGESREDLVGWTREDVTDRAKASDDAQPPAGGSLGGDDPHGE